MARVKVKYEHSRPDVARFAVGPEIRVPLKTIVAAGALIGKSFAPRSDAQTRAYYNARYGVQDLRRYADSFGTEVREEVYNGLLRATGILFNDNSAAVAIEFGNRVTEAQHPLAKTLDRMTGVL